MGWWKAGDGVLVGDEPLDTLGDAVAKVVRQYRGGFGRRPSVAEWEELLAIALGHEEDEFRSVDGEVPAEVRLVGRSGSR